MQNQEVKGNLARLLATENLIVEHRVVETASFDVDRRVLVLPIWNVSSTVYNMLVGHEVGHALFTPNKDWGDLSIPKSYINITEDARIEKLMKRKFPGLAKDFFKGYSQLNDQDFFDLQDTEIAKLNLIDRINLHYKVGSYQLIPFNDAEIGLRDAVGGTETFEEAVAIAEAIYEYERAKKEEEKVSSLAGKKDTEDLNIEGIPGDSSSEKQGEEGPGAQSEQQEESEEGEFEGKSNEDLLEELLGGDEAGDLDSKTDKALAQNLADQASKQEQDRPKYLEVDSVDLKHHVIDPHTINKLSHEYWGNAQFTDPNNDFYRTIDFTVVDAEYRKFKRECSREVNYLSKEFEMKKAASAYAREQIAKTGVLDTAKLHTYKFNDDIFKKVTVRKDGKNHGLIFLLDWSGSMAEYIHDTMKQLLSLCFFCRKSNIPFDVYAFVQDGQYFPEQHNRDDWKGRVDTFYVPDHFFLLNYLNNKLNSATFDKYARDLWRVTYMYESRYGMMRKQWDWTNPNPTPDAIPNHLQLGGTPLNEAVACLQTIIPEFQARNKVEKVHVSILSDGEAAYSAQWVETEWNGKKQLHRSSIRYNTFIRDRRSGRTYAPTHNQNGTGTTKQLLQYLKGRFPQCNFLGFRICTPHDLYRYLGQEIPYEKQHIYKNQWTKNKSCCAPILGFQEIYFLSSKNLNVDTEFEPKSDSKADIKRAFTKSLKNKANNKKILSSFIAQIA
tara:strand:- start:1389 stop:3560 length:2172 start_codon:yes stop_codon:yes gene_type:complete